MSNKRAKQGKFNQQADRFFQDMRTIGSQTLMTALDIEADTAEQIINEISNRLKKHWGGSMFYVAKNSPWEAHQRDLKIWQAFNGKNHHELVQRFQLCLPYIYEILANMRSHHHHNDKQKDLFDTFE